MSGGILGKLTHIKNRLLNLGYDDPEDYPLGIEAWSYLCVFNSMHAFRFARLLLVFYSLSFLLS